MIEIKGARKLQRKLNKISKDCDKLTHEGLMRGGKIVQAAAKLLAHVDTGELRESITVESLSKTSVAVGTSKEHGVYEEFGTGRMGDPSVPHTSKEYWRYQDADGNWYTTHGHEPHPFLSPALDATKDKVVETVKETIKGGLK
ncbi:hypothetical protein F1904_12095 [Akkermansia muciniphila]|uniref:HK97-gp10 family putative phage morphogenesis protein n=1 Tax=Akkermansia muciniphila TaxID=239935 RepID=UPI00122EE3AF|nr:hypothetical protein F1904_12095 [Akkermansia muciniphila]